MDNDIKFATAQERLRLARERVAAAETLTSSTHEELAAANANLERVRAGAVPLVADEMQESPAAQPVAHVNATEIGEAWPYRTPATVAPSAGAPVRQWKPGELPPPAYTLLPPAYRTDPEPQGPRRAAPAGWQSRRTGTTWGVAAIAVAASLLFHWLSQVVIGGLVGAAVGLDGLARITAEDFDTMNVALTVSTLIITVIVLASSAIRTYNSLTWVQLDPKRYGMSWWRNCWAPILLGTAAHAFIFWLAFVGATTG